MCINVCICGFPSHTGVDFGYESQKPLFKNVDFGIDMDSRSEYKTKIKTGYLNSLAIMFLLVRLCVY